MSTEKNGKIPTTLEEAMLTRGVALAIAYAAMHPKVVGGDGSEGYSEIMNAFQDWIPAHLIPENLWWPGHSWSSGRKYNVCHKAGYSVALCDAQAKGLPTGAIDQNTFLALAAAGKRHSQCTAEICVVTGTRPTTPNVICTPSGVQHGKRKHRFPQKYHRDGTIVTTHALPNSVEAAAASESKLLDRVRDRIRRLDYSRRTELSYVAWI